MIVDINGNPLTQPQKGNILQLSEFDRWKNNTFNHTAEAAWEWQQRIIDKLGDSYRIAAEAVDKQQHTIKEMSEFIQENLRLISKLEEEVKRLTEGENVKESISPQLP